MPWLAWIAVGGLAVGLAVILIGAGAARRPCPYCRESIDRRAVRCPHCAADLATDAARAAIERDDRDRWRLI